MERRLHMWRTMPHVLITGPGLYMCDDGSIDEPLPRSIDDMHCGEWSREARGIAHRVVGA